jgi:hypothetical protein
MVGATQESYKSFSEVDPDALSVKRLLFEWFVCWWWRFLGLTNIGEYYIAGLYCIKSIATPGRLFQCFAKLLDRPNEMLYQSM